MIWLYQFRELYFFQFYGIEFEKGLIELIKAKMTEI